MRYGKSTILENKNLLEVRWAVGAREGVRLFPDRVQRRCPLSKKRDRGDLTIFESSSGNVFADIGIPDPEEALAKADLADLLAESLDERGLTQVQAAEFLGVDQGSVSKLVNGRLDGFSQDRIIRYLNMVGRDVEIIVRPANLSDTPGRVVIAAG
jgi:predicted XRE-type DNA-binding protein